jgi:CRISPR/Cas system-associated endoribonuclease Cas2
MLSEAVVEKIEEELTAFFGTELASIVLYKVRSTKKRNP